MENEPLESLKALVIEDDPRTIRSLEIVLKANNIACDVAKIGTEGVEIAKLYDYDIIILDLLLPDVDGYEVLLRLRSAKINTPILILSALSNTENKIKGFKVGADDYLTKPFNTEEIIARIFAIVRRSRGLSDSKIKIGKMIINLDSKVIEYENILVECTKSEYDIIKLLALKKNSVVSKEMILNKLYGEKSKDTPNIKIVDVFLYNLRKKLDKTTGGKKYIQTIWGKGYMLKNGEEKISKRITY